MVTSPSFKSSVIQNLTRIDNLELNLDKPVIQKRAKLGLSSILENQNASNQFIFLTIISQKTIPYNLKEALKFDLSASLFPSS
uniref:Uncharacterized protein n=1 Tax=Nelumbo nucifera TaxID=4432 RepID=A0A822Z8D9_NELNU|nr:TPA_asm: hypothetical protein HUJ06_015146 [Nelumbo nucifera]